MDGPNLAPVSSAEWVFPKCLFNFSRAWSILEALLLPAQRQTTYLEAQMVTKTGTLGDFPIKKGSSEIAETLANSGAGGRNRTGTDTRPGGF
jgi:hypothetical protein